MELGNMSSLYTGLLTTQNTTGTKLKETVNNADYSAAADEMQKTVDCFKDESGSSSNSNLVDFFKDSAIQSLASTSTETQGLGLAQTMYEQMKRNYNL